MEYSDIRFKGLSNTAFFWGGEYDDIKAESQTSIDLEMVVKLIQSNTYFTSETSWCINTYNRFQGDMCRTTNPLQIVMSNHILDI